jgi:hypothetical protein
VVGLGPVFEELARDDPEGVVIGRLDFLAEDCDLDQRALALEDEQVRNPAQPRCGPRGDASPDLAASGKPLIS